MRVWLFNSLCSRKQIMVLAWKRAYGFVAQIANSAREVCSFSDQRSDIGVLREVESRFRLRLQAGRVIQQLLSRSGLNRVSVHVIYRPIP